MSDCNENCRKKCGGDSPERQSVDFRLVELHNGAQERAYFKMFIIAIIEAIIILMLVTFIWIDKNEYESVVTTIEAEQETSDGGTNYVVGGDMIGETESQSDS